MRRYLASELPEYNFECPFCRAPYCYLSADAYHYNHFLDKMDCYECGAELSTAEHMKFCSRILAFPEAVLEWKASPIDVVSSDTIEYIEAMTKTAKRYECISLSAPQVGWNARVVIIDGLVMINPQIVHYSGEETKIEECSSLPGYTARITRATEIVVEYRNIEPNSETVILFDSPKIARAVQHSLDHLDGKLILL